MASALSVSLPPPRKRFRGGSSPSSVSSSFPFASRYFVVNVFPSGGVVEHEFLTGADIARAVLDHRTPLGKPVVAQVHQMARAFIDERCRGNADGPWKAWRVLETDKTVCWFIEHRVVRDARYVVKFALDRSIGDRLVGPLMNRGPSGSVGVLAECIVDTFDARPIHFTITPYVRGVTWAELLHDMRNVFPKLDPAYVNTMGSEYLEMVGADGRGDVISNISDVCRHVEKMTDATNEEMRKAGEESWRKLRTKIFPQGRIVTRHTELPDSLIRKFLTTHYLNALLCRLLADVFVWHSEVRKTFSGFRHNDLSGDNCFVRWDGRSVRTMVADFGFAFFDGADPQIVGTAFEFQYGITYKLRSAFPDLYYLLCYVNYVSNGAALVCRGFTSMISCVDVRDRTSCRMTLETQQALLADDDVLVQATEAIVRTIEEKILLLTKGRAGH